MPRRPRFSQQASVRRGPRASATSLFTASLCSPRSPCLGDLAFHRKPLFAEVPVPRRPRFSIRSSRSQNSAFLPNRVCVSPIIVIIAYFQICLNVFVNGSRRSAVGSQQEWLSGRCAFSGQQEWLSGRCAFSGQQEWLSGRCAFSGQQEWLSGRCAFSGQQEWLSGRCAFSSQQSAKRVMVTKHFFADRRE